MSAGVDIYPAQPSDVFELEPQGAQLRPVLTTGLEYVVEALNMGPSFAGRRKGELVALAGVIEIESHRGLGWSILGRGARKCMLPITRSVSIFLSNMPYNRLEVHIDPNFPEARRWAEMLGFEFEGVMRQFTRAGKDMALYSLVRG